MRRKEEHMDEVMAEVNEVMAENRILNESLNKAEEEVQIFPRVWLMGV